jgi:hypothetical protein
MYGTHCQLPEIEAERVIIMSYLSQRKGEFERTKAPKRFEEEADRTCDSSSKTS